MELLFVLKVACMMLLPAKSPVLSLLPERLVTPDLSLIEPFPILYFSCVTFWGFHVKLKMKLIFFSHWWRKHCFWFCMEVLKALLVILGTRASESSLLFSFGGRSDSGHRLMRRYIEWLSTELWLQSSHSHTVSALTSQLLHSSPEQWFVFCRARAYQAELSKGTCSPGFNLSQRISMESMF